MIKRTAAFALLAGFALLAFAQLRTIPEDAKRGVMRPASGVPEEEGAAI